MSTGVCASDAQPGSPVVLELFTSQGCSSCPPADALLQKFTQRRDIVALTLPVDYWDYLGWKDTLASAKHTRRQREYSKQRGDGRVYTPQVVVDGMFHVNGSSERDILAAIEKAAAKLTQRKVPVKLSHADKQVVIEVGNAPDGSVWREATVWLALIQKQASVEVPRGENRGRTLTYFNVVRDLTHVGMWAGKPETFRFEAKVLKQPNVEGCAVLVQSSASGAVIGSAMTGL
jgi:hypothetical protein